MRPCKKCKTRLREISLRVKSERDLVQASGVGMWKCDKCQDGYVIERWGYDPNFKYKPDRSDCNGRHDNSDKRMDVYSYVNGPGQRALGYQYWGGRDQD